MKNSLHETINSTTPTSWGPTDLTPFQYTVLVSINILIRQGLRRFYTRDVCEQLQKFIKAQDNNLCKKVSGVLNSISKRIIIKGRKVLKKPRGVKKSYWEAEPELIKYLLNNANLREVWHGTISKELFYKVFQPAVTEFLEDIQKDRGFHESMKVGVRSGSGSGSRVFCLDRRIVEEAERSGKRVGELCVSPGRVYFDNVQFYDACGEFQRGKWGCIVLRELWGLLVLVGVLVLLRLRCLLMVLMSFLLVLCVL